MSASDGVAFNLTQRWNLTIVLNLLGASPFYIQPGVTLVSCAKINAGRMSWDTGDCQGEEGRRRENRRSFSRGMKIHADFWGRHFAKQHASFALHIHSVNLGECERFLCIAFLSCDFVDLTANYGSVRSRNAKVVISLRSQVRSSTDLSVAANGDVHKKTPSCLEVQGHWATQSMIAGLL